MTLQQIKYQALALKKVLDEGRCKNKHSVMGKLRQLHQRIREEERNTNNQNWLAQ